MNGLFYNYDEDFIIPKSLQNFLSGKAIQVGTNVRDIIDYLKKAYPDNKGVVKLVESARNASG
ncbi:hypothetical protein [Mucilaginibacter gracilis]|uniref:hypothetical protein n=1 Tax=Mucilaginibacter gracilis TaxID=423350 RepID=UPI000EAEAFB9|nr:hypothetical protein [Mucilaginibacter gracilis]